MSDCACKSKDKPKGHPFHGPACPHSPFPIRRRILAALFDPGSVLPRRFADRYQDDEPIDRWAARALEQVLWSLARHNAAELLGEPDSTHREYAVFFHGGTSGADHDPGIMMSTYQMATVNTALEEGEDRIGQYGVTWYTVEVREHRRYQNGSDWSSPWRKLRTPELVWYRP